MATSSKGCASLSPIGARGGVRSDGALGAHGEGRLAEHDIEQIGRVFDMRGLRPSQLVVTSRGVQETIDVATFPDGSYTVAGRAFSVEKGELASQLIPRS